MDRLESAGIKSNKMHSTHGIQCQVQYLQKGSQNSQASRATQGFMKL